MVRVSTQILLSALAASPAFAAPLAGVSTQYERDNDAQSALEARAEMVENLDTRISPALWTFGKKAFTAIAGPASLGALFAPLMFKKKKEEPPKTRSFDNFEPLDARDYLDAFDLDARALDDAYDLDAREPINAAALLKIGSTIGKVASRVTSGIAAHSKWAFPALAAGAFTAGAYARKETLRRSFDDDELNLFLRELLEEELNARAWNEFDELD